MEKIKIKLPSYPYEVLIADGLINNLNEIIEERKLKKNIFAVIDKNFYTLYKKQLEETFTPPLGKFTFLSIDARESQKTISTLRKIYSSLVVSNYSRDSLLIAIGGGIVGDVAGFAAATYARGIQYIQVPTTLLSAVDSSVGGKTGINFGSTKNIIGSFYQPRLVLIDTALLKTLPKREITSGIGEIVKYAFLMKDDFFEYLHSNLHNLLDLKNDVTTKIILESVKYKSSIVIKDEKEESGIRKALNLGHTFGHAIEIERKHKLRHGEAVLVGLACALFLSNKLGMLDDKKLLKGLDLIKRVSYNIKITKYDENRILSLMKRDKKSENEIYKFVLLKDFGKVQIDVEASNDDVIYALREGINQFRKI